MKETKNETLNGGHTKMRTAFRVQVTIFSIELKISWGVVCYRIYNFDGILYGMPEWKIRENTFSGHSPIFQIISNLHISILLLLSEKTYRLCAHCVSANSVKQFCWRKSHSPEKLSTKIIHKLRLKSLPVHKQNVSIELEAMFIFGATNQLIWLLCALFACVIMYSDGPSTS